MNTYLTHYRKIRSLIYFFIIIGFQSPLFTITVSIDSPEEALHVMIKYNDIKRIEKLNLSIIDLDREDEFGYTPLHWAYHYNSIDVAKLLIKKGCNIHTKNHDQWSLLHTAAANNHIELLTLCIQKGLNIESEDKNGWTPLQLAVCNNAIESIKLLLNAQADINHIDNSGSTALFCLANYLSSSPDLAEMLINAGANINIYNYYGLSPLKIAVQLDAIKIAQLLINAGAIVDSLSLLQDCTSDEMRNIIASHQSIKELIEKMNEYQSYCTFKSFLSKKYIKKIIAYYK